MVWWLWIIAIAIGGPVGLGIAVAAIYLAMMVLTPILACWWSLITWVIRKPALAKPMWDFVEGLWSDDQVM